MNRTAVWIGRAMSALVVLAFLADAATGAISPATLAAMCRETGFPVAEGSAIGLLALVCAAVYAFPPTVVLGAILTTGYLGGAICAHVRLGEWGSPPEIASLALGLLAWGGLYLRDARILALLPLAR